MAQLKRLFSLESQISQGITRELLNLSFHPLYSFIPSDEILRRGAEIAQQIYCFEKLPRAMDFLRKRLGESKKFKNGTVAIALEMTGAKGRFTRSWFAPRGGLWLSMAVYDSFLPETRGWLPILVGFSLVETVTSFGVPARQKWVNDVLFQGKKLAGVLVEQEVQVSHERWFLIGVGLNVNNFLLPGLAGISLKECLGKELSLAEVAACFLAHLRKYYGLLLAYEKRFLQEEDIPNPFPALFYEFSDTIGRYVAFAEDITQGEEGRGLVKEIDPRGRLIITTSSGEEIILSSGEILYI